MPINVYTGLMGSGKSYESVSEVIVPAILAGRDVVTNVDGLSEEKIFEYLSTKHPDVDNTTFGKVRHVVNEDVFKPDFFPYYDDSRGEHTDTIVQPGDLVVIDEAWRFWGTGVKLLKQHQSFFLEHRHFVNKKTKVSCDLVLMIQDISTLHRFVKNVIAFSFRTHRKVSLGLSKTYSVTMWEGSKMTKGSMIGNWIRKYDPKIFPLYSSFKGGEQGKVVNADSRQNIFSNKMIWIKLVGMILLALLAGWKVWHFFHPVPATAKTTTTENTAKGQQANDITPGNKPPVPSSSAPPVSTEWRVVGALTVGVRSIVLIADTNGRIRVESPSMFQLAGIERIGRIDGERISTFSGALPHPVVTPTITANNAPVEVKK